MLNLASAYARFALLASTIASTLSCAQASAEPFQPSCCATDGGVLVATPHWALPPIVFAGMTYEASFDELVRLNGDSPQFGMCATAILPVATDADIGRSVGVIGIGTTSLGCATVLTNGSVFGPNGMTSVSGPTMTVRFVWAGDRWYSSP